MIILTPFVVAGLIGKLYIDLSFQTDKSNSYVRGYLDTIYHYESALKSALIFDSHIKEIPLKRRLFSLKYKEQCKWLVGQSKEYDAGMVDANNYIVCHVENCYRNAK